MGRLVQRFVACLNFFKMPLDHSERVRVRPEPPLWIEFVVKLPVDSDVFASVIIYTDRIKQYLEFDYFIPEFGCESYVNHALLALDFVFKCHDPLFNEIAALMRDFLIEFAEILRQ